MKNFAWVILLPAILVSLSSIAESPVVLDSHALWELSGQPAQNLAVSAERVDIAGTGDPFTVVALLDGKAVSAYQVSDNSHAQENRFRATVLAARATGQYVIIPSRTGSDSYLGQFPIVATALALGNPKDFSVEVVSPGVWEGNHSVSTGTYAIRLNKAGKLLALILPIEKKIPAYDNRNFFLVEAAVTLPGKDPQFVEFWSPKPSHFAPGYYVSDVAGVKALAGVFEEYLKKSPPDSLLALSPSFLAPNPAHPTGGVPFAPVQLVP